MKKFEQQGVAVAAVSYDSTDKNKEFVKSRNITYTMLSDQNAETVNRLKIRNERYSEGHDVYGIPHPGVFYIDKDRKIVFKRAEESYRDRPAFDELLAAVTAEEAD